MFILRSNTDSPCHRSTGPTFPPLPIRVAHYSRRQALPEWNAKLVAGDFIDNVEEVKLTVSDFQFEGVNAQLLLKFRSSTQFGDVAKFWACLRRNRSHTPNS